LTKLARPPVPGSEEIAAGLPSGGLAIFCGGPATAMLVPAVAAGG
jgi:hypothetical protein